ncbi:MAG: hypothetical protein A2162_02470 [Deltaproteobacteria bacterium RBG_13_52_11b]|nr:MAG: hypothetical protein A2162_02470 [Deltaproteobacteria bacterium RBG_13_52_11b]
MVLLTKSRLDAIKTSTQVLQASSKDKRYADFFLRTIESDVEKTDSFIRGLMNYVKVSSPVRKTNTVQTLVEEALQNHQSALQRKQIRFFKRLERDLPETSVPDAHLRYILDSLLHYVVADMHPFETVTILTRSSGPGQEKAAKIPFKESCIEIVLLFTGHPPSWQRSGAPTMPKDEPTDLPLLLIKETVVRNRGRIKFQTNEDGARTMVTLTLPVERRSVFCYATRQE